MTLCFAAGDGFNGAHTLTSTLEPDQNTEQEKMNAAECVYKHALLTHILYTGVGRGENKEDGQDKHRCVFEELGM